MKGRELRQFALECLKAARQTNQITDKESYRIIAEGLIRRANELDELAAPRPRRHMAEQRPHVGKHHQVRCVGDDG
jgi:hypothetical protein